MDKNPKVNEEIERLQQVRVVDEEGQSLGIMLSEDAIKAAEERGLDIVEVAPEAAPPVCKIMDYGKFRYEQRKKEREAKKKQHVIHVKEVRFRPRIDQHDFDTKIKRAKKFLIEKNKVKVTVMFRGREMAHLELGTQLMDRIKDELQDISNIVSEPKQEGRFMTTFFLPK